MYISMQTTTRRLFQLKTCTEEFLVNVTVTDNSLIGRLCGINCTANWIAIRTDSS